MSAHTPGPWSFRSFEPDGPLDDVVSSINPQAGIGDVICLSPEHGGFEESTKRWADNSRLIAAAPELLEALSLILGSDDGARLLANGSLTVNHIRAARSAVDKATGAA